MKTYFYQQSASSESACKLTFKRLDRLFAFYALAFSYLLCVRPGMETSAQGTPLLEILAPEESNSRPGSAATDVPFSGENYLMTAYRSSLFEGLAGGGYLHAISFRSQEGQPFSAMYAHINLYFATFPQPIEDVPSVLAAIELFPDATQVFSAENVQLTSLGSASAEVPSPFDLQLRFDKPFYYNSSEGNLLMFVDIGRVLNSGAREVDYDNLNIPPHAFSASLTTGPIPNRGPGSLVTRFDYTAIPEPSTSLLTVLGMILTVLSKYVSQRVSWFRAST